MTRNAPFRRDRAFPKATPRKPPTTPPDDEEHRDAPVDQPGRGVVRGGRRSENRNGDQRGADSSRDREARGGHQAGNDEKSAANAEEAGKQPYAEARRHKRGRQFPGGRKGQAYFRGFDRFRVAQHGQPDSDHQHAEERQEPMAVDGFRDARTDKSPDHPREREHSRAAPAHVAHSPMRDQVGKGANRNRNGARTDSDVRRRDPHAINEQGNGQDRTAAPD